MISFDTLKDNGVKVRDSTRQTDYSTGWHRGATQTAQYRTVGGFIQNNRRQRYERTKRQLTITDNSLCTILSIEMKLQWSLGDSVDKMRAGELLQDRGPTGAFAQSS